MQIVDLQSEFLQSRIPLVAETKLWLSPKPLVLEQSGIELPLQLAYQTWGTLNKSRDNAILVVHALSGSANLGAWWPDLLGQGKPLDPDRDFVICINLLGSCYGSTGPISQKPDSDAQWKNTFPAITVRDQTRAQARLIRALGIKKLRSIIGPSLGGMIALEWALLEPELTGSLILIATTAQHSAQAIANSSCQRAAIRLDPDFNNGDYSADKQPKAGLALARQMAFIGYRSEREFSERFNREPGSENNFAIQDYLAHQGRKFVERFDANSYISLSKCMNSHDIGFGRGGVESALASILQASLVISLEHDQLYSYSEQAALASNLSNATHQLINTRYGHDGFLIETEAMSAALNRFLNTRC